MFRNNKNGGEHEPQAEQPRAMKNNYLTFTTLHQVTFTTLCGSKFLRLLILIVLLLAVRSDAELIYTFLFKVLSSGKLIVENYLQFQKMRYNDKKKEKLIGAKRKRSKADNDTNRRND